MTIVPIVICTVCYLFCSYSNLKQRDYPHALMWFSYAIANTGLLWYEIEKMRTS